MSKPKKEHVAIQAHGPYQINRTRDEVQVDLDSFVVPHRTYAAQVCRLERLGGAHVAYFGQLAPPNRLASMIGIQLNDAALADFHKTLVDGFRGSVRSLANLYEGTDLFITDEQVNRLDTDRMFTVNATIARVVVAGYGAQVDWYDLTPRQMRMINQERFADAGSPASVVTLAMSVQLLQIFMDEVDKRMKAIKDRAALPPAAIASREEPT